MSYIISRLDISTLRTHIIYSSNSEDNCKAQLLDLIQNNKNINKVIENDYIKSYTIHEGYLYNSKNLESIYQILKVKDKYEINKSK